MRDYQLSMMQILLLRYNHNSCVTVSANRSHLEFTIARFNESNEMYGYLRINALDENASTQLEDLVKHGYNPEVAV